MNGSDAKTRWSRVDICLTILAGLLPGLPLVANGKLIGALAFAFSLIWSVVYAVRLSRWCRPLIVLGLTIFLLSFFIPFEVEFRRDATSLVSLWRVDELNRIRRSITVNGRRYVMDPVPSPTIGVPPRWVLLIKG
jgi:hypothetical protein